MNALKDDDIAAADLCCRAIRAESREDHFATRNGGKHSILWHAKGRDEKGVHNDRDNHDDEKKAEKAEPGVVRWPADLARAGKPRPGTWSLGREHERAEPYMLGGGC